MEKSDAPRVTVPTHVRNRGDRTEVHGVRVFSWNPRRPISNRRYIRRIKQARRVNNFGDLLGPIIVERMLAGRVADDEPSFRGRVLAIGSILHFAQDGDVVWGAGVNGKMLSSVPHALRLDARAVRGPLTRNALARLGVEVPAVYGDPALLVSHLLPSLVAASQRKSRRVLLAPNLNELHSFPRGADVLNPQASLERCLQMIAESDRVVGSSLHALVIADALRIPTVPIASRAEHPFKYQDYYEGTGREGVRFAPDIDSALSNRFTAPEPQWDPEPLMNAFPFDLWKRESND